MSDEFPTLEAVLVVSNLVLAWRLGLLFTANARVRADAEPGGSAETARRSHHDLHRAARRKNRAGADVVIAAVLGGALLYAWAARFDVGAPFYALGALAVVLLLMSAVAHTRLARAVGNDRARKLANPAARRAAAKPVTHCRECGAAEPRRVEGGELGPRLGALGVEALSICAECGHVEGRARAGTW